MRHQARSIGAAQKSGLTITLTSRGQLGAATLVGAPGDTAGAAMKTDSPFGSYEVSVKKFQSIGGRKSQLSNRRIGVCC